MKVERLSIKSFRGIDDLTLEFNPDQPTVFIGNNGVGKSSILDCLAILLSRIVVSMILAIESRAELYLERKSVESREFYIEDIKKNSWSTKNQIIIQDRQKQGILELSKDRQNIYSYHDQGLEKLTDEWSLERDKQAKINDQGKPESLINIPIIIYYPVNRAVFDVPLEINQYQELHQINAYEDATKGVSINFESFFKWFRMIEDKENEDIRDDPTYRDKKLEAVRNSIYSVIPEFTNLRVRRSPLKMTVEKNGEELIINQLSDGEKCLLAMVGDIGRRLAIANPSLENPLEGEGIILIDEIELHLHPQWQREIIPALTRTFPHCQFIITTHSPQVLSAIQPENIYILESSPDGIIAAHPDSSYGRDSNQILEDLMGTPERPQLIKNRLEELFQLIDQGDLEGAKQLRKKIAQEIGEDEPELTKAAISIRRKEILKR